MKTKLIVILSALVLGLSGYMLYDSLNNEMSQAEIQEQFSDLKSDYEYIQKDLEIAISDVNFSNKEILVQKKRIEKLMGKNKITQEELAEAKQIMRNISQSFIKNFKNRITLLEGDKTNLVSKNIVVESEISKLKEKLDILDKENIDLGSKINKEKMISRKKDEIISYASKLNLSNFILKSFKIRSSGKEVETDKASKIDRIKVYFTVNENKIAESGKKTIYMVIKKPTGEIVTFSNKTAGVFTYKNRKIQYSDSLNFDYVNIQEQNLEFVWDNEDFSRGDYIIEVYETTKAGTEMIGKATKSLN